MPVQNILFYAASFIAIWFGSGLIISSVGDLAKKLRLSSFALSFFLLGILTSIPELGVGLTSLSEKKYSVFTGNLLGGIPLIFLLVIPLFAVMNKGVSLNHKLNRRHLMLSLLAVSIPAILCVDGVLTKLDGVFLLLTYGFHIVSIGSSKGIVEGNVKRSKLVKSFSFLDLGKVLFGAVIVFLASHIIVDQTVLLAESFSISPFVVSLIFLSIGTNIPELSLAVRSSFTGKQSIAFGDYIGSAAANVLFLGIFTLMATENIPISNNPLSVLVFTVVGHLLFYLFMRSGNKLTIVEAVILLLAYLSFSIFEYKF